jgi:hypothetical protein
MIRAFCFPGKVGINSAHGSASYGHDPLFTAFTLYADEAAMAIKVITVDADEFALRGCP